MSILRFWALVDIQARMSLKAEASKLYLSYLWWILEPVLWALTFYFVFEVLLQAGRGDFLLFLMCGKVPFLWFSKSVTSGSGSIRRNKGLINQIHVPKALFPYASVQEALYKQVVVFVVLLGLVLAYGYEPSLSWFWLIPLIVVQYLLIVNCALIGSYFVSFVPDIQMLIQLGMMFLMFSSGIFWDVDQIGSEALRDGLLFWNPLAFLIDGYRTVLMEGGVYDLRHLAGLGAVAFAFLALSHALLITQSRAIAARVINT